MEEAKLCMYVGAQPVLEIPKRKSNNVVGPARCFFPRAVGVVSDTLWKLRRKNP